jgi:multisubunit Na+/H+ antiporter MnhB subunit
MRHQIAKLGLPTLLVLMGVAVILILTGAGDAGLTFGLVVAGTAGALLVLMLLYEAANTEARERSRENRIYRRPYAGGL